MKNTLNVKLAKVLEYGSIALVTDNDVEQHPEWVSVDMPAYIFTPRDEHKETQDTTILGKCYDGPARLINLMFEWLKKEESELQ